MSSDYKLTIQVPGPYGFEASWDNASGMEAVLQLLALYAARDGVKNAVEGVVKRVASDREKSLRTMLTSGQTWTICGDQK